MRHHGDTGVSLGSLRLLPGIVGLWESTHETLTIMSGTRKKAMNLGPKNVMANSVASPTEAMPKYSVNAHKKNPPAYVKCAPKLTLKGSEIIAKMNDIGK